MKLYCKFIDEEKGLVQVGAGCSDEYYREIGMEKRNVRQSDIDGQWYLYDKCPMKPEPTANDRRKQFLKDFFNVEGFGYYRKEPKGYKSAIESINTADSICQKNNGLPAGILIFYEEPDFNDASQCTEEWLTQHQIIWPALSVADFNNFYIKFVTTWNTQEHN